MASLRTVEARAVALGREFAAEALATVRSESSRRRASCRSTSAREKHRPWLEVTRFSRSSLCTKSDLVTDVFLQLILK
jgi:hypothetical protein